MRRKQQYFIFWELLAAFFIFSYQTMVDMIGTSTAIDQSIGIVLSWLWILMALLCMAVGIITLR